MLLSKYLLVVCFRVKLFICKFKVIFELYKYGFKVVFIVFDGKDLIIENWFNFFCILNSSWSNVIFFIIYNYFFIKG